MARLARTTGTTPLPHTHREREKEGKCIFGAT